jgi:hypothetical protein
MNHRALVSAARCGRLPLVAIALCLAGRAAAAGEGTAPANLMGIGIGAPLDWGRDCIYADVVRMAREFGGAPVDKDGWPLTDATLEVWADPRNMHGTYALSFRGQAASVTGGDGVAGLAYDEATNTSTARVQVNQSGPSALYLAFKGTRRSPSSNLGSGVTHIQLMRPLTPGSSRSYPRTALFHEPLKALVSKVQVVRFMDFLGTSNSQQHTWAERPLPSWASFQRHLPDDGWQGIGGPWEHVIAFANEVHRDAWINIPVKADDDYVRKVALTFRYGSDGVNPYSSPQAKPVHPPLDPELKLYVEYSNELWNSSAPFAVQFHHNHDQAVAEVKVGSSPLAFDGLKDPGGWTYAWRRVAKRTVEISNIFRSVFGDGAMTARIRPVVMTQQGNDQDTLQQVLRILHGYYNNGEGSFVANPHPPSYYIYGAGGSGYYNPDNSSPSLTLESLWNSQTMNPATWHPLLRKDADRVAALGVKRVAYEGGPSFDRTGNSEAAKAQAWGDPRMKSTVVEHHDTWSAFGGDLLVYFTAAHDYQWGFTQDIYDLNTPKLRAIDELRTRPRTPLAHGNPLPGTVAGNAFAISSRGWDREGSGSREYTTGDANERFVWASYTFRAMAAANLGVALSISGSSNGQVAVYWDGALLGQQAVARGSRVPVSFGKVEVSPGLHGLVVRAVSGSFKVDQIAVQ